MGDFLLWQQALKLRILAEGGIFTNTLQASHVLPLDIPFTYHIEHAIQLPDISQ